MSSTRRSKIVMPSHSMKAIHRPRDSLYLYGRKTAAGPLEALNRQILLDPSEHNLLRADGRPCVVNRRQLRRFTLGSTFRDMFRVKRGIFRKRTEHSISDDEDDDHSFDDVSALERNFYERYVCGPF